MSIFLFVELEKRMMVKKNDKGTTGKPKKKKGGIRELKRFQSFINYNSRSKKHKETGSDSSGLNGK